MFQALLIAGGGVLFGLVCGALYVLRQFQKGFRL
jgi:hypothetical protein